MRGATLEVFFRPEATAHNGEKGAQPEPFGKRPIRMKVTEKIVKDIEDLADNAGSFGKYVLDVLIPM
jgi:hypothetical protein